LTGLYPPTAGRVLLGDADVTRLAMHERVKRGLVRTFQINTLFPGLIVLESVVLAICAPGTPEVTAAGREARCLPCAGFDGSCRRSPPST
jgi:ABC-type branched-subunit amino acid transport system ATPase component